MRAQDTPIINRSVPQTGATYETENALYAPVQLADHSTRVLFCFRVKLKQQTAVVEHHFDLAFDGAEPVDMRVFLRQNGKLLSETWLYLFEPATLKNLWPA